MANWSSQRAVSLAQRVLYPSRRDRDLAVEGEKTSGQNEGKREKGRTRGEGWKARGWAEGGTETIPDVHRTLFFILHYPCSAPLCPIMPAPRINDESRCSRATVVSIGPLPSRNTDKHRSLWPVCARHATKMRSLRRFLRLKGVGERFKGGLQPEWTEWESRKFLVAGGNAPFGVLYAGWKELAVDKEIRMQK